MGMSEWKGDGPVIEAIVSVATVFGCLVCLAEYVGIEMLRRLVKGAS